MTRRLLLALSPGEIWAALVADGELAALRLVRTDGAARAGDIYRGRVVALRPALPAALIDIGEARPGFLGAEDMPSGTKLREGETVLVRVSKAARADKAAGLSMRLDPAGSLAAEGEAPALLRRAETALAAVLGEFADADAIVVDDSAALAEAKRQGKPVTLYSGAAPLFEAEDIAAAVAAAQAPRVALPGEGAVTIESIAAATIVDVDGGRAGAAAANLAAASEIARQVRLRDLSGPIVIDFIGMKDRGQRASVEAVLKQALGEGPDYLGWTRLGHYELVLKRRRPSLTEQLYEYRPGAAAVKTPLTVALEALRALQRESRAAPGKRLGVEVHPDVAASLGREARAACAALAERLGYPLKVVAGARPRDGFAIVPLSPPS